MFEKLFSPETLEETWRIIQSEFLMATWETVYVTLLATAFAIILGLPLGVLLVVTPGGIIVVDSLLHGILHHSRSGIHIDLSVFTAHSGQAHAAKAQSGEFLILERIVKHSRSSCFFL